METLRSRDYSIPTRSNSNAGATAATLAGGSVGLDSAAVGSTVSVMGSYAMSALLDTDGRQELRNKCSERLQDESGLAVQYAEQAVLANLDWGIESLEKALRANNPETRAARLEHTEKMLQVAILLDPKLATAGVANSYLAALANYYMALVWKLRNDDPNTALHFLEMFLLEPAHARKTFAPALWDQLFRPHMANIEAWFQTELAQITNPPSPKVGGGMFPIPPTRRRPKTTTELTQSRMISKTSDDTAMHSRTLSITPEDGLDGSSRRRDELFPEILQEAEDRSRRTSLSTDQLMRLELLTKLYEDSLSENTEQYAQYYKDWMLYDADSSGMDGESEQNSPPLPRIVNPSHTSFVKLQEPLGYGPRRSPERSSMSAAASDGAAVGSVPAKSMNALQRGVSGSRHFSMDLDSCSEGYYSDAISYPSHSRNSSLKEVSRRLVPEDVVVETPRMEEGSIDRISSNGDLRKSGVLHKEGSSDEEEDEYGTLGEKGAGVYLDGEELREDELLQVWEEISEGRIGMEEANDFLGRLTNSENERVDLRMLSETAQVVQSCKMNHQKNDGPLESAPVYGNSSNSSDSISEGEEVEDRGWQESDKTYSRENLSVINPISPSLSRQNVLQQKVYSREQSLTKPPKDFVCSITDQLFKDPVTLETGQTYERVAIKEWLDRGNTSCPITRQVLKNRKLPKTNFVLKRLVDNWKDDHPDYSQELTMGGWSSVGWSGRLDGHELEVYQGPGATGLGFSYDRGAGGMNEEIRVPGRRFGQKVAPLPNVTATDGSPPDLEDMLNELRAAVDILFRTEDIVQCERAVLVAMQIWVASKFNAAVASSLSKAGVVEGLMEVLARSKRDEILRSVVCLLSELITKDEFTRHTIMRSDPSLELIVAILKNPKTPQVAVLLHLLKVPPAQISAVEVIPSLVSVVKSTQSFEDDTFSTCITPKVAAVNILEQLVTALDHRENMANAEEVVIADGLLFVMEQLEAKVLEEKVSAVAVLWSCLQARGDCRMLMVQNLKMSTLVDLLHNNKEQARTVAIFFLAELICLNRRSVIEKVLKDVLLEGILNSMHVLMLHLQMSPVEHRPLIASLLLQLDLLADAQKHSVYREEGLEALVEALSSEEELKVQLEAAKALASLSGRYSSKGSPSTESALLKYAGLQVDRGHSGNLNNGATCPAMDQSWEDEQRAADEWDQRMALAVLGGGKPLIEALGVALSSKSAKVARLCLVAVAWISCSLQQMPDANLKSCARNSCLPSLLLLLQTSRDAEGRVLACLSLHNLTDDAVGIQQLSIFAKDLIAPLRRLRRYTWTAKRVLEALATNPSLDVKVDMWSHGEVGQQDVSRSGEIRALVQFRDHLYSGHVDASIKIWSLRKRMPRIVQEARVHSRAVLCLAISEQDCKLFSGSLDKSIRIWLVEDDGGVRCVQVIDMKEAVHSLAANSSFIFAIPPGIGLKVFDASGANPRVLNGDKHVQSIAVAADRIYCGCTDSTIQEIDPESEETWIVQAPAIKGKKAVYSLQLLDDELFAGGKIVDGAAAKAWQLSTTTLTGSIPSPNDVRVMAVSADLIYLAGGVADNLASGAVEVWSRNDFQQVDAFQVGSRVLSFAVVGETIYLGSVDGKLRAWGVM